MFLAVELDDLIRYFGSPRASFWDFFAVAVIILFVLLIIGAAFREWRVQSRARQLVIHRYGKGGGARDGRLTRRSSPRLPVRIPVKAMELGIPVPMDGEVLDVSVGGLRLLLYDPPDPIEPNKIYTVVSSDAPLSMIGSQRMKVVLSEGGPDENSYIVRGQWVSLSNETAAKLNQEIRHRLLHGR